MNSSVRVPVVAGLFYPDTPESIHHTLDKLFQSVEIESLPDRPVLGAVVPHAGWRYSGSVAAYSYFALRERQPERVIIIGPSHREIFNGATIYDGPAFRTPLGEIPVDREFIAGLAPTEPLRLNSEGHTREHAIEVQLPFLQHMYSDEFRIVPVSMGTDDEKTVNALADLLVEHWTDDQVIIASSDLSHYHRYEKAVAMDTRFHHFLERGDLEGMRKARDQSKIEACGFGPVQTLMKISEQSGWSQFRVLHYANSGDITGDRSRVVGYLAAAVYGNG